MPFPYNFTFMFDAVDGKLQVAVAFASNPMDASWAWQDVTADIRSIASQRGRQRDLDRVETGTLDLELLNTSGNYWPGNTGGAYYPNVAKNKPITLRRNYNGTTYDLFTGVIQAWEPVWLGRGGFGPVMRVKCTGVFKFLSKFHLNDGAGYAQELSGTRVGNVLDDIGWPAGKRNIDAGQDSIIASGALVNVNAMNHLYSVQETEISMLIEAPDGDITYEDRAHRSSSPHTVSQATFGDDVGGGEMRIITPALALDDTLLFNQVRGQRDGGTEQVANDSASQTANGVSVLSRSGLLLGYDVLVAVYCNFLLARYKETDFEAKALEIMPEGDPANLWPKVLGYDISTRITLNLDAAYIAADYFIEGIRHEWSLGQPWRTFWQLSNASKRLTTPDAITITLRPNGAGTTTQFTPSAGANWQCVDEATPNDDTDYVYKASADGSIWIDTDALEDSAYTGNAVINWVKVYIRARATSVPVAPAYCMTAIRTVGADYFGVQNNLNDTNWQNFLTTYNTNPNTGVAWTWAQIQALEAGLKGDRGYTAGFGNGELRCTQVYVEVNFTPTW